MPYINRVVNGQGAVLKLRGIDVNFLGYGCLSWLRVNLSRNVKFRRKTSPGVKDSVILFAFQVQSLNVRSRRLWYRSRSAGHDTTNKEGQCGFRPVKC